MHRTPRDIASMKGSKRIAAVTSYDYTMAALCERAGIDVLLVGDSAGMVMLGHAGTERVTMSHMCTFTSAVAAARREALLVADLPFMSYQAGAGDAVRNSGRLVRAGADAVKLEGGAPACGAVRAVTGAGIPVMGHIGMQPQTAALSGGGLARGRTPEEAAALAEDARALEEAGAFCVVLEMVSREAAAGVTRAVGIPTIGIGSGAGCDGQVLVLQDLLGMYERMRPRFAKRYAELAGAITGAVRRYREEVESGAFPAEEHGFPMGGGRAGG